MKGLCHYQSNYLIISFSEDCSEKLKPVGPNLLAEFYAFKAHKKVHFEWSGNNIGAEYSVIITSTHFTALNVTQIFIIKCFVWQIYKLVHHNNLFLVILEFWWSRAAYVLFILFVLLISLVTIVVIKEVIVSS